MPRTKIDIESRFALKVLMVLSEDHLSNTRVVMNESGHAIQDNSYYPFGMAISSLSYDAGLHLENKFKYNGKHCAERSRSELLDDFGLEWYDYGARFYDREIGRWHMMNGMVNNNTYLGINYMTFNLNSKYGFTYNPYKGIYSEFQAGTAFLNAGASYDWFYQSFNPQANVGLVGFGNGPLRYTPISFGYLKGVGFDFRVSFNLGKLMHGQMKLHNSFIKNLGYHPGINLL